MICKNAKYSTHWQTPLTIVPALETGTVHLWQANLDEPHHLTSLLSSDEKARAEGFKFPIHQQRFTRARAILRCILARYLNQDPEKISFKYTSYGKPSLCDNQSIYFNLSHANQWALYAISRVKEIGVDIEQIRADTEFSAIAQRFFSKHENQLLNQLPAAKKQWGFFHTWTCKEAFIKALGEGLSFPLQDFDVDVMGESPRLLTIRNDKQAARQWSLLDVASPEGYVAAMAIKAKIAALELWRFTV